MQLPGIITITGDKPELVERAADVLARGFMEEPWFMVWLTALDALGTSKERQLEIMRASMEGEFLVHAPLQAVYATEDFAGVAGGYLASEFGERTHPELQAEGFKLRMEPLLTAEERAALDAQDAKMAAISDFAWAAGAARADFEAGITNTADHIYFYAWTVDAEKRGTGAFRRLTQPFFDFADERGINCYLECYNDDLQSLYEHVGFEVIDTRRDPALEIYERCMVRRPAAR